MLVEANAHLRAEIAKQKLEADVAAGRMAARQVEVTEWAKRQTQLMENVAAREGTGGNGRKV